MKGKKLTLGCLMFRIEGEFWNVYFGNGPEDAIQLGKIQTNIVSDNPEARDAFMTLFVDAIASRVFEFTGLTPTMETQAAPEHERSGSE